MLRYMVITATRPATTPAAAQVLDGRLRFERKAAAFFGALVRGYTPPFRDSQVISLADRREQRSAA